MSTRALSSNGMPEIFPPDFSAGFFKSSGSLLASIQTGY
jgi:hypothetical protein